MSTLQITEEQKEKLAKITEENFWHIAKQVQDDVKVLNEQKEEEKTAQTPPSE
ncbi:hypothetical protein [uncultured Microscilla sp.]|uniref:hypothetical protein n=1 Tax=uncultured Microscilla sp. TaxID=432653 RepID=UPI00260946D7|nr:hypothetical protein [uncultured Microscilla sp.]